MAQLNISPVERLALTVEEAAKAIGTSPPTVRELIRSNRGFPAIKVSENKTIVPVAALSAWLEREVKQNQLTRKEQDYENRTHH